MLPLRYLHGNQSFLDEFHVGLLVITDEKKALLMTFVIEFNGFINLIYGSLIQIRVVLWKKCVMQYQLYAHQSLSYGFQVLAIIILFLACVSLVQLMSFLFLSYVPTIDFPIVSLANQSHPITPYSFKLILIIKHLLH